MRTCPHCNGHGKKIEVDWEVVCEFCNGQGYLTEKGWEAWELSQRQMEENKRSEEEWRRTRSEQFKKASAEEDERMRPILEARERAARADVAQRAFFKAHKVFLIRSLGLLIVIPVSAGENIRQIRRSGNPFVWELNLCRVRQSLRLAAE